MSARAIRALRENQESLRRDDDDPDDDESSIEDSKPAPRPPSTFSAMIMNDSDEEESSNEEEEGEKASLTQHASTEQQSSTAAALNQEDKTIPENEGEEEENEDDLDTLLDEFRKNDIEEKVEMDTESSFFSSVSGPRGSSRDLDIDAAMRNALLSDDAGGRSRGSARGRQTLLFGPPRDNWPRPPHYVGGGIGMVAYSSSPRPLPWPYSSLDQLTSKQDMIDCATDHDQWFTFQYADSCTRDLEDYKVVQQTGDLNALVMFVAHHPYVTDAVLQTANVLYQTNHSQEGLALLRRCLWVYECSALLVFNSRVLEGTARMDMDQPENSTFFRAIFRLAQASHVSGIPRTASAACRYLLALDPLRDPMNVLSVVDSFSVLARSDALDWWLVEMVEKEGIEIFFQDSSVQDSTFRCHLRQMPNWMLSFSLAQYRLRGKEGDFTLLRQVLSQFPEFVGMILQALDIDIRGRSFRRDWPVLMEKATERGTAIRRSWSRDENELEPHQVNCIVQTSDKILELYARLTAKLWEDEELQQLLYDTLESVLESTAKLASLPPAALMRYAGFNPKDFESRVELLPQDANIMDPGMVNHAMVVQPNRPRFLRHFPRGALNAQQQVNMNGQPIEQTPTLFGPPTNMIDPDWPILEVFWRSFLPWNQVEGVPPPRR